MGKPYISTKSTDLHRISLQFLLFSLLLLVSSCGGSAASTPSAAIQDYTHNLWNEDWDAAAQYMPPNIREKMSKTMMESTLAHEHFEFTNRGEFTSIEILEENISDDRASVRAKLHFKDKEDFEFTAEMCKTDGAWHFGNKPPF